MRSGSTLATVLAVSALTACHPSSATSPAPQRLVRTDRTAESRATRAEDAPTSVGLETSNLCADVVTKGDLESLLAHADFAESQAALDECFVSVVLKFAPVYRSLLTKSPTELRRPFGYGLEDQVLQHCAAPGSPLDQTLRSFGICRNVEMADVILDCLGSQLSGPRATLSPDKRCAIREAIESHHTLGERARWISLVADALPVGVMKDRHGRGVPIAFRDALRVLDYLADHSDDRRGYDIETTKPYDEAAVAPFLSARGVRLTNLTDMSTQVTAHSAVMREIAARQGEIYERLAHVGYIYASPYPQYSGLTLPTPTETELVIEMAGEYRLTFSREGDQWKLGAIGYYEQGC
jgi:hypothetical protein